MAFRKLYARFSVALSRRALRKGDDMRCYKGKIVTGNPEDAVCQYLVEDQGKIVYVGDELPEEYAKNGKLVDLKGRALLPAFVDTHQHFASFSTFHAGLNVMDAESNTEIMDMVRKFVAESGKKKTLIAFGASPYSVKERRLIHREELDQVCPDKEIMVVKYDG
ncbi:MAG: amidohydrolase family protein, partial [Ruminococcus bromii]|nr:amidohydrolase family protein [Ruminococcus bromii]